MQCVVCARCLYFFPWAPARGVWLHHIYPPWPHQEFVHTDENPSSLLQTEPRRLSQLLPAVRAPAGEELRAWPFLPLPSLHPHLSRHQRPEATWRISSDNKWRNLVNAMRTLTSRRHREPLTSQGTNEKGSSRHLLWMDIIGG